MSEEGVSRRLAAIVAADVAGYSRLMAIDEEGTLARLRELRRELIDPALAEAGGRIVKTTGDGLLIEFASVVDAVRCSVAVQREMAARNAGTAAEERIAFRVGINQGDIIVEDEDIYGDGVNVAARLEEIAEPGGISISERVHADIRGKLDVGFQDLGEQTLKNIPRPVRVYRIALDGAADAGPPARGRRPWPVRTAAAIAVLAVLGGGVAWWQPWLKRVEAADPAKMAFELPRKPSIAVLPFDNLSGDDTQADLADGLTEHIISTLATISEMFVIARNSTFTYKGKAVKVGQVAEELGVRYVLEGSVQQAGERLRVTAQLVDAVKGHHLWSAHYDRELTDLFEIQDDIALRIASALQVKLTEGEGGRLDLGSTEDLRAWRLAVKAQALFRRFNKAENVRARQLYQEALEIDPRYVRAWVRLGWTHWIEARFGWSDSRADSLRLSQQAVDKALALFTDHPGAHALQGSIHLLQGEHDEAIASGRRAIALAPSFADEHAVLAISTYYAGQFEEAVALAREAMRLHPHHPDWYYYRIGVAHMMLGNYEEAIPALKAWSDGRKTIVGRKIALATVFSMAGRLDEARELVSEILAAQPGYNLQDYAKGHPFKNPEHLKRILDALRKAGYPEKPPSAEPKKP